MKHRIQYYSILDSLRSKDLDIIIMRGLRRVGKTTILEQIKNELGDKAIYLNMRIESNEVKLNKAIGRNSGIDVILIDEFTSITSYEETAKDLLYASENFNKKIVITGSSSVHLKSLGYSILGAGRSKKISVPMITFTEYLLFIGKIKSYNLNDIMRDYRFDKQDFKDYLTSKDLIDNFNFKIDNRYLNELNEEINIATNSGIYVDSNISFSNDVLSNVSNLIAYKLNNAVTYRTFVDPNISKRETRKLEPSSVFDKNKTIIHDSVVNFKREMKEKENIVEAIEFLLYNDFACVETIDGDNITTVENIIEVLSSTKRGITSLKQLIECINISLCNPIMYMKLGLDILDVYGISKDKVDETLTSDNMITGEVYEAYIKGSYSNTGYNKILFTSKLKENGNEIDLIDISEKFICELTVGDKNINKTYLAEYKREDRLMTRVLSYNKTEHLMKWHSELRVVKVNYLLLCILSDLGIMVKTLRNFCREEDARTKDVEM